MCFSVDMLIHGMAGSGVFVHRLSSLLAFASDRSGSGCDVGCRRCSGSLAFLSCKVDSISGCDVGCRRCSGLLALLSCKVGSISGCDGVLGHLCP